MEKTELWEGRVRKPAGTKECLAKVSIFHRIDEYWELVECLNL